MCMNLTAEQLIALRRSGSGDGREHPTESVWCVCRVSGGVGS